jgi:hypothetical protein
MTLGKPTHIVDYKGVKVRLYRSGILYKLLNRGHYRFTLLEKNGFIPKPKFYSGKVRLYSTWEIQTLCSIALKHGIPPRFSKFAMKSDFVVKLKEAWADIHSKLDQGKEPESPVKLEFASEKDLALFLKTNLEPLGFSGDLFFESLKDIFLQRRSFL